MYTKELVIEAIRAMPDSSFENIDILLERLVTWSKIERGVQDILNGNVVSDDEAKKELFLWPIKQAEENITAD